MQLWDNFLADLEKDFGKETIDKWLRTLVITRFDAANLQLKAQDSFQANWFEEHIREKAAIAVVNSNGKPIKIKIDVDQNQEHAVEAGIRGVPTVMIYKDRKSVV